MSEEPEATAGEAVTEARLPESIRGQLRSAAEGLAQQFGGTVDLAEEAVLASALEVTKDATVLQYASVLAVRRARQRLREAQGGDDDGRSAAAVPPGEVRDVRPIGS